MGPEETVQPAETPLEQAGREEAWEGSAAAEDARAEHEADVLVADIDAYIAETDPQSLAEAEKALDSWEIPNNPLFDNSRLGSSEALVSVFAAGSEGEAAIVRGMLESQGIPTTLDGLPTRIMGNVFDVGEDRWGDILVPADQADEARSLLAEVSDTNQPT